MNRCLRCIHLDEECIPEWPPHSRDRQGGIAAYPQPEDRGLSIDAPPTPVPSTVNPGQHQEMASATEDLPQDLQVQLAGYIAGIGRANPTWDLSRVRVEFGNQIESFFNRIQPPSPSRTRSQPSRPLYPSHGLQQQFPQHGPGSQRHSTDFGHTPGEAAAPNDFFRPRTSRSTRASNHNAETE